jgi:ubiquinone/menaquinone biosynthesis C-methylase UbiE
MRRFAYLIASTFCFALKGNEISDEALCKQPWSQFGPLCQHYVVGRKDKPEAVYAILKKYVSPTATILDLGSGTGISTRQLWRNGFKNVIGVDRDHLMIKEANAANNKSCSIKYIRADVANELPFSDEQFDVVTASSAFHWFANPSSIKEVARILKPQGYYFIIGSESRLKTNKPLDPIKVNIARILEEAGVSPKPKKDVIPPAEALEKQGFKIITETTVPYVNYYTKQEFLERIQSYSSWNLVKESQRDQILRKIDQYLDTVVDEKDRIKQEGNVSVVLAQKMANIQ